MSESGMWSSYLVDKVLGEVGEGMRSHEASARIVRALAQQFQQDL
jgi:hypothetical protein